MTRCLLLALLVLGLAGCWPFSSTTRMRIEVAAEPQLVKATMLAVIGTSQLPDTRNSAAIMSESSELYASWVQSHVAVVGNSPRYVFIGPAMRQGQRVEVDYPEMHVRLENAR